MKLATRSLSLFALTMSLFMGTTQKAAAISEGDALPPLSIPAASSSKSPALTTESMKNKVTVINFWATWCQACKVELVEMADIFTEVSRRPNVRLAFVSLDKNPDAAISFLKERTKAGKFVLDRLFIDPKFQIATQLEVDAFPMTLVIDKKGHVAYVQKGFTAGKNMTEKLHELVVKLDAKPETSH